MAFVNLPANLQDMFYALSDRIMKLETGPNQAMYTAEAADSTANSAQDIALTSQSVATNAQIQAINAGIQANIAASQATLASSQATQAQLSANGKNTIYYGTTSTPGTGNITGASANGTTITYQAYNGLQIGQSVTISGIANNTATITGASGNGTTVTYTANNNFAVGQVVTVSGINNNPGPPITAPVYNLSGTIVSASSTQFAIASTVTGAYSSGGTATAPSLLNTSGTVASQSFTQFSIASTRRGTYTSGGSLNVSGLTFQVGDIYFQYNTSSQVIAQSTWNGSAWQSTPITNTVITNLDAGKITTGIITSIEYNNGSGTFRVTPAGALTASSATITGTINADTGYFGSGPNRWSIGAGGITGIGTASITGGLISGSSISIGTGATTFQVNAAGFMQATGANITGAITATSGSFTGTVTANAGNIAGFTIGQTGGVASYLYSGNLTITSDGTISGGNSSTLFYGYVNIGGGFATGARLIVAGNSELNGNVGALGNLTSNGSLTVDASATFGNGTANPFLYLASSGTLRSLYTYGVARSTATRTLIIDSSGNFGTAASTRRKKHEIESYKTNSQALLNLDVKKFKYNLDIDPDQTIQYGFIAEEAQELGLHELIQLDSSGIPDYFSYEKLPIFLLQLIQELKAEIDQLKGA